jgi:hypothetical protein
MSKRKSIFKSAGISRALGMIARSQASKAQQVFFKSMFQVFQHNKEHLKSAGISRAQAFQNRHNKSASISRAAGILKSTRIFWRRAFQERKQFKIQRIVKAQALKSAGMLKSEHSKRAQISRAQAV